MVVPSRCKSPTKLKTFRLTTIWSARKSPNTRCSPSKSTLKCAWWLQVAFSASRSRVTKQTLLSRTPTCSITEGHAKPAGPMTTIAADLSLKLARTSPEVIKFMILTERSAIPASYSTTASSTLTTTATSSPTRLLWTKTTLYFLKSTTYWALHWPSVLTVWWPIFERKTPINSFLSCALLSTMVTWCC